MNEEDAGFGRRKDDVPSGELATEIRHLARCSAIVEATAYRLAGYAESATVGRLILIAADLERIAKGLKA